MYNVAIITASDKGYAGEREDKSGQTIEDSSLPKGCMLLIRSFFLMTAACWPSR